MKAIKFMGLMLVLLLAGMRAWAVAPPDTLYVQHGNGEVTKTNFAAFNYLKFADGHMVLVGSGASETVSLDDIQRISFRVFREVYYLPVTFSYSGTGALYASVVESGISVTPGDWIEAGLSVKFRAVPNTGYKVSRWRINGVTEMSDVGEKTILLDKDRYASGLKVEVEFIKEEEPQPKLLVTFGVSGNGGTLSAFITKNGTSQPLSSGERVEAGQTILFKAEPSRGYKVKGWRINGNYTASAVRERSISLDKDRYASGLKVEVEFVKKVGLEETEGWDSRLSVYVQHREIGIESAAGIERVELLDTGGHLIRVETYARGALQVALPAGDLESGLYILKIRTAEREEIRKVIIR